MSYISDKIAEVRALGHVIPEGIEELFLTIEAELGLDKKHLEKSPEPNPLDGTRVDS